MSGGLLQLSGIVVDLVHRIDHLPQPGEEVETPELLITAGGGFNALVAAKRQGANVAYGGTIGTGPFADIVRRQLVAEGIAAASSRPVAIDQGTCSVLVDASGERSFISCHGAERRVDRTHLDGLQAHEFGWLLLTGYSLYKPETASAFVPWLQSLPTPPKLFFDPGPVVEFLPAVPLQRVLDRSQWVSANAREAQVLTGEADPVRAAASLAKGRDGALVRRGSDGCWLAHSGTVTHLRGFKVATIDSNGAGDAHDGAFLAALIAGRAPRAAAEIANAAAALSTTRLGPAASPGLAETLQFLTTTKEDVT